MQHHAQQNSAPANKIKILGLDLIAVDEPRIARDTATASFMVVIAVGIGLRWLVGAVEAKQTTAQKARYYDKEHTRTPAAAPSFCWRLKFKTTKQQTENPPRQKHLFTLRSCGYAHK